MLALCCSLSAVVLHRDPANICTTRAALDIREDPIAGTYVPAMLYAKVSDYTDVLELMQAGRTVCAGGSWVVE